MNSNRLSIFDNMLSRRHNFGAICLLILLHNPAHSADVAAPSPGELSTNPILQRIVEQAKHSAYRRYQETESALADGFAQMSYQQYRAIRFDAEQSVWRDTLPFEVQFFHPGFLYRHPVNITLVNRQNEQTPVPFDTGMFRYDKPADDIEVDENLDSGFAGFRLHYPINGPDYKDEFLVFLGASYFRLIGQQQVYGISARGLAIDTGLAHGEEFPRFTDFWLIEPEKDQPITIYARLDSPSISAAYKFVVSPGEDSQMQVSAWLFAREDVEKLGIAPFTSMFLYGEHSQDRPDDYRPEVHDSDGMLLLTQDGEQIWRPLTNPQRLQITSLNANKPAGFGLLQRDISFAHYLDEEASYHRRPGLWAIPEVGFEKGKLELVEIPTKSETHDNIVAYWVPEEPVQQGDALFFRYRLKTVSGRAAGETSLAQVRHTRQGAASLPGHEKQESSQTRRFVVDFSPAQLEGVSVDDLQIHIDASHADIGEPRLFSIDNGKSWRLSFLMTPQDTQTVDMRAYITHQQHSVSEVWNYVYQPNDE